jgi:hypothetical protein
VAIFGDLLTRQLQDPSSSPEVTGAAIPDVLVVLMVLLPSPRG